MASISLFLFSLSILVFQSSCSKTQGQPQYRPQSTPIGKIIYATFGGQVFISNYDGSNANQVNFALPPNVNLDMSEPRFSIKLSPDGQKIFFSGDNTATGDTGIYSCDSTGNNVTVVNVSTGSTQPILCGVY